MAITSIIKENEHSSVFGVVYKCVIDSETVFVWGKDSSAIQIWSDDSGAISVWSDGQDATYQEVKEKIGEGDVWP
jgi:hypothetical protein